MTGSDAHRLVERAHDLRAHAPDTDSRWQQWDLDAEAYLQAALDGTPNHSPAVTAVANILTTHQLVELRDQAWCTCGAGPWAPTRAAHCTHQAEVITGLFAAAGAP